MSDIPTFILILSGAATGLIGAMLGLGGGVFLVPLLALALGVPIRTAIAASLISVIATASASSTINLERGVDRKSTRLNSSHIAVSRMPSSA